MKKFFTLVTVLFFSYSCLAMEQTPAEEFKNDFAGRIQTLKEINTNIQSLNEEKASSYFGNQKSSFRIKEIKNLFSYCTYSIN